MKQKNNIISYKYLFHRDENKTKKFVVNLDAKTLDLLNERPQNPPGWTKLNFYKCSVCPLSGNKFEYCPNAVSISELVDFFSNFFSTEKVKIDIITKERNYSKATTVDKGISSLMGIFNVTAGCPILSKLKPMVKFHLPFANLEETLYRVVSMYLVRQYFAYQKKGEADWELNGLKEEYNRIHIVNQEFCQRLSKVGSKDANLNALIKLDTFANYINVSLVRNKLSKIEWLFEI